MAQHSTGADARHNKEMMLLEFSSAVSALALATDTAFTALARDGRVEPFATSSAALPAQLSWLAHFNDVNFVGGAEGFVLTFDPPTSGFIVAHVSFNR